MLFPEADAPLLKNWIVKRLENTSDADAEVLAEYLIALLKHEGTKDEVRKLCDAEIKDFLTEDPKVFLDDVFQVIAYKSYLPGAAPPPPPSQAPAQGAQGNGSDPVGGLVGGVMPPAGPRKRGYHDLDAPGGGQEGYNNGPRPAKNSKRQGRGRGKADDGPLLPQPQHSGEFPPMDAMPMPPYGPGDPMAAFMNMMPFPGMPQFPPGPGGGRGGKQRRRGRCRDFDRKGYCARGSTCMFDHGGGGNEGGAGYQPPYAVMGQMNGDYNPEDTMMVIPASTTQPAAMGFPPSRDSPRQRGNRKANMKGRSRAPFSAEGPVNDRSKTTIVVEDIPEENFSEEQVRAFFSQFGSITEVSMQPYKHLAIVKYDTWASANAAYRSPKVIFDNRFVRVFWFKDGEKDVLPPSVTNGDGSFHNGAGQFNGDGDEFMEGAAAEPEMDPEEFQRRQEEAQRQHQERETKRSELERQRQELEKKQAALMEKHREETQRLQTKLLEKSGGESGANGSSSGTDMLRAKLALLEQEAKILGIDPDAADDVSSLGGYSSRGGGGYRGRGRGAFRGRGRGRGGAFGGVDSRHAAYAQYTIDNRPKKLALTGIDFMVPEKDESLRHFLLQLGEFESVEPSSGTTYVSFRDRKTAERMYYTLNGKGLPGVEDGSKLDLQWVNTPLPPVGSKTAMASSASAGAAGSSNGNKGADNEVMDGGSEDGEIEDDGAGEMDYNDQRVEDDDAY